MKGFCSLVFSAIKATTFFICGYLFLVSAFESLALHNSGLTTSTKSVKKIDKTVGLPFPTIIVCNQSGFKTDQTVTDFQEYNENTVAQEDILEQIDCKFSNCQFEINTIYSAFNGRCYGIKMRTNIQEAISQFFIIQLKKGFNDQVKLLTIEQGFEYLLAFDIWIEKPIFQIVNADKDTVVDFVISQNIIEKVENCVSDQTPLEYMDFVRQEIIKNYPSWNNCSTPWMNYFMKREQENARPCSKEEAKQQWHFILDTLPDILHQNIPCQLVTFSVQTNGLDRNSNLDLLLPNETEKDRWNIFTYYGTTDTQIIKQIPVMSVNDLISAIGGTMGLFLGFSFLGSIIDLLDLASKFMQKLSQKNSSLQK